MTEEKRQMVLDRAQIMVVAILNEIEDPDLHEVVTDVIEREMEGLGRYMSILFDLPLTGGASEPQT